MKTCIRLSVILLVAGTVGVAAQSHLSPAAFLDGPPQGQPISAILRDDGSIRNGASGSFDPKGFRMITKEGGMPRFVAEEALTSAIGCGDRWDDRFFTNGVSGGDNEYDEAYVYAAAVDGSGNLYVGGSFIFAGGMRVNNIAKWDGQSWSALGLGTIGQVYAITVSGSDVYVGGYIFRAGSASTTGLAKWNGYFWTAIPGLGDRSVNSIAVLGTDIYVGGSFPNASGIPGTRGIAKWNGTTWSALGSGIGGPNGNAEVAAVVVSGSNVYVGGSFTTAGGLTANSVAKWDGTNWSVLGTGVGPFPNGSPAYVTTIAVSGSDVYVGGNLASAGGVPGTAHIARWDGSNWSSVGAGIQDYSVRAIWVSGTEIYVGGEFTVAGGVPANNLAKWNGSEWSAVGSGTDNGVYAIAVYGSDVYVGGQTLRMAGGVSANRVAKWDGSTWSALGSGHGVKGTITSVGVSENDVYVGGWITLAGRIPVNGIARWNGLTWSALGSGIIRGTSFANVNAIEVSGTDVYVGGEFTTAGGNPVNNIAKWNGTDWSELGEGLPGPVYAIAVSGADVYAAGNFTTAGGTTVNHIAKWNGTTWSALGSGVSPGYYCDEENGCYYGGVYALAIAGQDLYAGGWITAAGGSSVNNIAKWNGSSWSAMGNGSGATVYTIAASGTDVYVGGSSSVISKWNGAEWSQLGTGVAGGFPSIRSIALSGSDVYVAGGFTGAGQVPASRIAKWNGSTWSALGSGITAGGASYVTANVIAASRSRLYVGGYFSSAGCHAASNFSTYSLTSKTAFDFDGDGRSDISVFRPSDSVWYLNRSAQGFLAIQFGLATDKIVPADYDGDGTTDLAVYRDGAWWIMRSTNGTVETRAFGQAGDIPVPADYTGDGRDELAVYRNGQWWSLDLSNEQSSLINFGLATDKPVPADYDGDGRVDQAVYRNGEWHINRSTLGYTVISFGLAGDRPVVGDYDADGRADLAVYRDGTWYLQQSTAGFSAIQWGLSTDIPTPADYDGDGKTDAAVFRDGTWYLNRTTSGVLIQQFGLPGDKPVEAAYSP